MRGSALTGHDLVRFTTIRLDLVRFIGNPVGWWGAFTARRRERGAAVDWHEFCPAASRQLDAKPRHRAMVVGAGRKTLGPSGWQARRVAENAPHHCRRSVRRLAIGHRPRFGLVRAYALPLSTFLGKVFNIRRQTLNQLE
jgi:hypothetical protein